jgi:hypothetical protein
VGQRLTQEASQRQKRPLASTKLRQVPSQFRWVDQRLVRERALDPRSPEACALYRLLGTGADAQGWSFSSAPSLCQRWSLTPEEWRQARGRLVHLGLVAYERPLSQGLALGEAPRGRERATLAGDDAAGDIKAVFAQLWEVLA